MRFSTLFGVLPFLAAAMAIPITSPLAGRNWTDVEFSSPLVGRNWTDVEFSSPGRKMATRGYPGRNSTNPFPGHKVADGFFGPGGGGDGGHHNSTDGEEDDFFLPPVPAITTTTAARPRSVVRRGHNSTDGFFPFPPAGPNSTYPFLPPDIPVEIPVEEEEEPVAEEESVVVARGQYIDCIMSNQDCTPHTPLHRRRMNEGGPWVLPRACAVLAGWLWIKAAV